MSKLTSAIAATKRQVSAPRPKMTNQWPYFVGIARKAKGKAGPRPPVVKKKP